MPVSFQEMFSPSLVGYDLVFEKEQVHDFDFIVRSLSSLMDLEEKKMQYQLVFHVPFIETQGCINVNNV